MVPLINQIEQYLRKSFFFLYFLCSSKFHKRETLLSNRSSEHLFHTSHIAHSSQLHGRCRSIRFYRFLFIYSLFLSMPNGNDTWNFLSIVSYLLRRWRATFFIAHSSAVFSLCVCIAIMFEHKNG